MNFERRIGQVIIAFALVIAFGVLGLMAIEGWPFLDALYMTVITISTVGYSEVRPLSPAGKMFIITFIIVGVGAFLFGVATVAEYILSGQLKGVWEKKRMKTRIAKLKGHYLICGFGRVGQQVAMELKREGVDFVVIDTNPTAVGKCGPFGYLSVEGSASNDEVLKDAGIMTAAGLVSAIDSDAENVYVSLSAKNLRKDLYVVARASSEEAKYKLSMAGADRVISPYTIGGKRLAGMLLRPNVVEFLDFVSTSDDMDLFIEEVAVRERSPIDGLTIGDAKQKYKIGANILAIKNRRANKILPNPESGARIENGDLLIILGTRGQLHELEGLT